MVKTLDDETATVHSAAEEADEKERRGPQAWVHRALPENGPVKKLLLKLFTNEDHTQLHKTLGFLSVLSFLYRYFWVYPTTGSLGFTGSWFDHATLLVHLLLSVSSLIFHVIARRILNRPMIIWEEYRLHAIVFTSRSVAVYLFGLLRPFQGTVVENVLLAASVLAFHVLADYVTSLHGSKDGSTTVRIKDNQSADVAAVLRFYALYQFSALGSHLVPNDDLCSLGFNTLIAIQSSAFLMTLYRKSVITYVMHGFWYSLCLVVSFFHIIRLVGSPMNYLKLSLVYALRTKMHVSKYVLWTAFAVASVPQVEQLIVHAAVASLPEPVQALLAR
mmetsp:Transcript_34575/g.75498  ORF Transcript_34575/g.75498 Transcript_34575/m.75498 type:complete len:332 (-) Transcript_34575:130-1125(-)